ncbi:hypothetical protein LA345_38960 (plasmid) [Burkholderia vietnamiensis]|uniref:Tail sheath protein subtilisin-like domain-containing protein n=1 Tax=Burkholderia vietnamiensis (strain G4 / LMG 22486) TaxID=269482 RepID=A4JWF2_BURVG|nr:hypothetical protein Bcep1808_7735 [Burkholderia vietnamiensis G4]MCB4349780.1 hypothetical protein [Burkholderia vietnamiensis]
MFYSHTRSLGAQSGVQLNPLKDNTDGFSAGNGDQVVGIVGRFKRGRIDAPFVVDRGTLKSKLGAPESLRVSALNEAYVQLYEAVNNGAVSAVVQRLAPAAAARSFAVLKIDDVSGASTFSVSPTAPTANYLLYLDDLECFNDGVLLEVNAKKATSAGAPAPSKIVTIRVKEPNGNVRYEVTGSLDQTAVDEYGNDYFIGSKFAELTDLITVSVSATAAVATNADCYGRNTDGTDKFVASSNLVLFSEGGTAYASTDYDAAISKLENGTLDFGYLISGGSQAVALLSKLAALCVRANRHFVLDVPGSLTPDAAQTFVSQLGLDTHYVSIYWAPLNTNDPVNGGKAIIGLGGFQAGQRCARNAQTNSYGLAPKNYPIAGKDWPINRTGVVQLYTPSDVQKSDLALAKINPVILERYTGGSKYVFVDSLTAAQVTTSYRKLISVAEMSASLDDMVVKYGKECLQLPMDIAIKRMTAFLKFTLTAMRASNWLVASNDPVLGDAGWTFTVTRNAQRPADRMDVNYGTHYDGVNRATYVQQTLSQ